MTELIILISIIILILNIKNKSRWIYTNICILILLILFYFQIVLSFCIGDIDDIGKCEYFNLTITNPQTLSPIFISIWIMIVICLILIVRSIIKIINQQVKPR